MAMLHQIPLGYSYSKILACLSGNEMSIPVDITTKIEHNIPMYRGVSKINLVNTDYSDRKPAQAQFHQSRGYIPLLLYVSDTFPKIYAKNKNDKLAYDEFPAITQIKSIEVKMGNYQVETLTPFIIFERIYELFKDNFEYIANEWLGGSKIFGHKHQVYEGYTGSVFNETNFEKNLIKNEYRFLLPVVASLFLNEEKFKFGLSTRSIFEATFNFNNWKNFTHRSDNISMNDLQGSLDVYVLWTNPSEPDFFNGLPYFYDRDEPTEKYFINDVFCETYEKKFAYNQDFKLNIRQGPTMKFKLWLTDLTFTTGTKFFGISVAKAAENFIAAHITASTKNTSPEGTINLSTGKFLTNHSNQSGPWVIENFDQNKNFFDLKFNKNNTTSYIVKITCATNWVDLGGDLYFDLNTFQSDSRPSKPYFYYFDTFHLNIVEYNTLEKVFKNTEDNSVTSINSTKIVGGFFTFMNSITTKKYAFCSVDNIRKSLVCDDLLYKYSLSLPVPTTSNTASIFATKEYVTLNYTFWSWYDLDQTYRQRIDQIIWEKGSGMQEIFENIALELLKNNYSKQFHIRPDWNFEIEYRDYEKNKRTYGFLDMMVVEYSLYFPKLFTEDLIFDGQLITDILKDRQINLNSQVSAYSIQDMVRTLYYNEEKVLAYLPNSLRSQLNSEIIDKVLVPSKMIDMSSSDNSNILQNKYQSEPLTQQRGIKRSADPISANNSRLAKYTYQDSGFSAGFNY